MLDTNAVLDWLLFDDPRMRDVAAAIEQGLLRWVATAAMRGEFTHVLGRRLAVAHSANPARLELAWGRHCDERPAAQQAAAQLRCTDSDDQKFVDFALATGARWLLSRDRAVLKLRRRATAHGLLIAPPEQWRLE